MRSPLGRMFGCLVTGLVMAIGACGTGGPSSPHTTLVGSLAPLRTAFDADSGEVRAIFLASPTCPDCLRGVRELERAWLSQDSTRPVSVYLVWSSQLGATEANVADATTLIPDRRVRHFWDRGRLTGKVFAPIVGSEGPAWDVWMLFGPRARWTADDAPTPSWWEHQLEGLPADRHLNARRFARKAAALEAEAQRGSRGESRR